jgi:hypothetical protein
MTSLIYTFTSGGSFEFEKKVAPVKLEAYIEPLDYFRAVLEFIVLI